VHWLYLGLRFPEHCHVDRRPCHQWFQCRHLFCPGPCLHLRDCMSSENRFCVANANVHRRLPLLSVAVWSVSSSGLSPGVS
jgi:hypothetical protein